MSASFLHWSYLHENWDQNEEKNYEKYFKPFGAYFSGMIGHSLCILAKPIITAVFVIFAIGLTLRLVALRFAVANTELRNDHNVVDLERRQKIQILGAFLVLTESIIALGVDGLGIVCPPAAYKLHDYCHKNFIEQGLKKIEMLKNESLVFSESLNDFFGINYKIPTANS